ncbi:Flp family type IVb pilin [Vibrio europaeus]|uniref:Flp family type IVb pilin n=1 Tax=Vibrio europaeus TaxID=300876 RepID=UPI0023408865|nr:Flp family type IVb pilin [Vibrio europaeus]MDC5839077.1 Flp family type IVb pilin [Vibrio europaeus]
MFQQFFKSEEGVTAIEYAVIGVAMATVLGLAFVGMPGGSETVRDKLVLAFDTIKSNIVVK